MAIFEDFPRMAGVIGIYSQWGGVASYTLPILSFVMENNKRSTISQH